MPYTHIVVNRPHIQVVPLDDTAQRCWTVHTQPEKWQNPLTALLSICPCRAKCNRLLHYETLNIKENTLAVPSLVDSVSHDTV